MLGIAALLVAVSRVEIIDVGEDERTSYWRYIAEQDLLTRWSMLFALFSLALRYVGL